jgi:tetratricopeptide (TPR) repeat protein
MRKILAMSLMLFSIQCIAQSADEYYQDAVDSYGNDNYKQAIAKIDKAIDLDSNQSDYYLLKGDALVQLQEWQGAYEFYSQGIEKFPEVSSFYNGRGYVLTTVQQYDYAIEDYSRAMLYAESDTLRHMYVNNRAAAKLSMRDFKGGYEDLLVSYSYDTTDLATLTNLGAVCDEIGKNEETLMYLNKAIEIDSAYYPAYANIGFKYQEMGQHEKAIEYYDMVLSFAPDEPLGYSNRSYNRMKVGDLKGAMKDIEKSLKLYPSNPYAYKVRALIYIESEKIDKACEDLQTALDKGYTITFGNEVLDLQKQYCN